MIAALGWLAVLVGGLVAAAYVMRNRLLALALPYASRRASEAAGRPVTVTALAVDAAFRTATVTARVPVIDSVAVEIRARVDLPPRPWTLFSGARLTATGELTTGGSRLSVALDVGADGALADARCGGKIAVHELAALGLPEAVRVPDPAELVVDARATGTLRAPAVAATVFSPALRLVVVGHAVELAQPTAKLHWERPAPPALEALDTALEAALPGGVLAGQLSVKGGGAEYHVTLAGARFGAVSGLEGEADVEIGAGWNVPRLAVRWRGATLEGSVAPGPAYELALAGLAVDPLKELLRPVPGAPVLRPMRPGAPPGGLPVPPDLTVGGRITTAGCSFTLATPTSQLFLTGDPRAGFAGWKLSGRLSPRDINTMEWWAPVKLVPEGEVFLDMVIAEAKGSLRLAGPVRSPELTVRAWGDQPVKPVACTDVSAIVDVGADDMRWSELKGKVFHGEAGGGGWMGFAADPFPYTAQVDWVGLSLGQYLAPHLTGSTTGKLAFAGHGADTARLTGEGGLTLTSPDYRFLAQLAPRLAPYGLPPPSTRGNAPGRARLAFARGRLVVSQIEAGVPGVALEGTVSLGFDGSLAGTVDVDLAGDYLRRSPLFALPASMTKVIRVPATLSGTVRDPAVEIDFAQALSNVAGNYAFGDITRGLTENYELGSLTKGLFDTFRRATGATGGGPLDLDAIFEKILSGAADADRLMERLASSGMTEAELKRKLADYRKRRGS